MDLVEFLLARIVEDQGGALIMPSHPTFADRVISKAFILAECEAKHRIVGLHARELVFVVDADGDEHNGYQCAICRGGQWPCETLELLAIPYGTHPDYDAERWL